MGSRGNASFNIHAHDWGGSGGFDGWLKLSIFGRGGDAIPSLPAYNGTSTSSSSSALPLADTVAGSRTRSRSAGPTTFDPNLVREQEVAEHAKSLELGIMDGLYAVPRGRQRALECDKRHGEILEGLGQIQRIAEATEKALQELEADPENVSESEHECLFGRIKWATGMIKGLQRGVQGLMSYDSCADPGVVYSPSVVKLADFEQHVARLCDRMNKLRRKHRELTRLRYPDLARRRLVNPGEEWESEADRDEVETDYDSPLRQGLSTVDYPDWQDRASAQRGMYTAPATTGMEVEEAAAAGSARSGEPGSPITAEARRTSLTGSPNRAASSPPSRQRSPTEDQGSVDDFANDMIAYVFERTLTGVNYVFRSTAPEDPVRRQLEQLEKER